MTYVLCNTQNQLIILNTDYLKVNKVCMIY